MTYLAVGKPRAHKFTLPCALIRIILCAGFNRLWHVLCFIGAFIMGWKELAVRDKKTLHLLVFVGVIGLLVIPGGSGNSTPPPNYPVDAFDEVAACIKVPGCLKPEDRVEGDIALAAELTYRNPICVADVPCIIVCDTHACWCEEDKSCY